MKSSNVEKNKILFGILCIVSILMPTQIIFFGVSWAISDAFIPIVLIFVMFLFKADDIKIKKSVFLFLSLYIIFPLLSLIYIFRNPDYAQFVSSSFVAVFKLLVCVIYSLLYYILFSIMDEKLYKKYLNLMCIVGTIFSFSCLLGVFLNSIGLTTTLVKFGGRANGFMEDPNLAAVFLLISIGYAGVYLAIEHKKITILQIILMCLGVVLTASKAALLVMALSLFFVLSVSIFMRDYKVSSFLMKLIFLAAACFILILLKTDFFDLLFYRLNNISNADDLTTGRSVIWKTALKVVSSGANIIYGVGIGVFEKISYLYDPSVVNYGFRAHNTYLSFLCECGIFMFLLLVYILGYFIKQSYKTLIKHNNPSIYGIIFAFLAIIIELFSLCLQNSRTLYVFMMFMYFYFTKFNKFREDSNE